MLFTTDPRAINYTLTQLDEFEKPAEGKALLDLLGEGTHSARVVLSLRQLLTLPLRSYLG